MYKEFKYQTASCINAGLGKKFDELKFFLPEIKTIKKGNLSAEVFIGKDGSHKSSIFGKKLAEKKSKKYISTSEGLICSVGEPSEGWPVFSMSFDERSSHKNPSKASGLEEIILKHKITEDETARAKNIIKYIKEHKITKYNNSINLVDSAFTPPFGKNILLIDETINSPSFLSQNKREENFRKMYEFACERYSGHNIIVKSHIRGAELGKSFLDEIQRKVNVFTINENVNNYDLFELADAVMCVESDIGFEALIAGKRTYCFGASFYSSWGLTQDSQKIARRKTKLSIEQLVAAYLIKYTRYLDPYTKQLTSPEATLELITWLHEKYKRHSRYYHCVGFKKWQEGYVSGFLKRPGNDVFFYKTNSNAIRDAIKSGGKLVVNSKNMNDEVKYLSNQKSLDLLAFDDGLIRSVQVAANKTAASSAVIDDLGIYYDAKFESRLEDLLLNAKLNKAQEARAQNIIELIIKHNINKYNYKTPNLRLTFPRNKKVILVIGQVENDPKITQTKSKIRSNLRLLEYVRAKNPSAFIIYKPHPEVVSGKALGHVNKQKLQQIANFIIEKCALNELMARADEVHTISSTCGFYGVIAGKQVFTYGSPFYAGWGLTEDKVKFHERTKKLTIQELTYVALVQYSMYFDIRSGLPCRIEHLIQKIVSKRNMLKYNESLKNNKSLNFIEKFILQNFA